MTVYYLIRHGHNEYVAAQRLAGRLEGVHLDDRGRAEADRLVEALRRVRLHAVYASPLSRTMETAIPIAQSKSLQVICRPNLSEIDYGSWQGQSLKALRRRKLWSIVQSSPSLARFPSGESFPEAQARVVAELEGLRMIHRRQSIACVSHADVIKLALAHYLGMPLDLFQRLVIAPGSLSILEVGDRHARLRALNLTGP
jgi:probable phosphomutase (TIGR03848 family)